MSKYWISKHGNVFGYAVVNYKKEVDISIAEETVRQMGYKPVSWLRYIIYRLTGY